MSKPTVENSLKRRESHNPAVKRLTEKAALAELNVQFLSKIFIVASDRICALWSVDSEA